MKTRNILILLLLFCYGSALSQERPTGLMTDLIEHTDKVWINGILSDRLVDQVEDAGQYQYALIASGKPAFSWIVPGAKVDTRQLKYHILVADSYESIAGNIGNFWDSGIVNSGKSTSILYGGSALDPDSIYYWKVKTYTDADGENGWSDVKRFKTAHNLSEYGCAYYPQVKTVEYPQTISSPAPDTYLADFGKDAFGQVVLTLDNPVDNDTLLIHLGECLDGDRIDRNPGGTIRYQRYRLPLVKGTHSYRIDIAKDKRNTGKSAVKIPDYIGAVAPFRYCEIEGYGSPLTIRNIRRESVHYPFDEYASSFECDNDTLNQIWDLCKYSIESTSFAGIYVDGDRERIPYEADALINQLGHYNVDREYSLARRSYEYLLDYPTWPTEWILQAIQIAWYDYLYTGDNRSLKATYERLKPRTLIALKEKNGLISTSTGLQTKEFKESIHSKGNLKDIVDWPHPGSLGLSEGKGGETDGFVFTDYNVVTNAYHYEVLKLMSQIAQAIDKTDDAVFYGEEAEEQLKRFNRLFFDKKQKLYMDGISTKHASLHGNMFPLAFNMTAGRDAKEVVEFIKTRGMACSVYGAQFLLDAVYEAGDGDYALELLTKTDDRSWYNMIRVGSTITLEAWDNKYKPNQDWNHAWGSAPANIIQRKLVGVEPMEPGFGKVRIRPQIGSLKWVNAAIPTVKGTIKVSIENLAGEYKIQITLPANMDGELSLPYMGYTETALRPGPQSFVINK